MIADLPQRTVENHPENFIAPTASVVGSVKLAQGVSVWFGAVIRGDKDQITVGRNSNIQDGAVLHADPGQPLTIGDSVTVGHNAMVHGCTVGDNALIGINAVILNGAVIGENSLVGANSLVPEGMEIPPGSLVIGSPAKVKRALSEKEIQGLALSAENYVTNGQYFREGLAIRSEN